MLNLTPFQNAILEPLRKVCALDTNFAINFINTKKKIEYCTYIINQVRKTGRQGFSVEEIYSMAIHYYQEDNIEVGKRTGNCQVVVNRPLDAPIRQETQAGQTQILRTSRAKKVQTPNNQTSLFDF